MGVAPRWEPRKYDRAVCEALVTGGCKPLVARVLAARGVSAEILEEFLDPSLARLLSPELLPGVSRAVDVILPFVAERRRIVVFGDYDADGVCATAILVSTLNRLGGRAVPFFPCRGEEGYGMSAMSLARLRREFPDVALVVTVDNGISSPDEVRGLRDQGVAVVVTDHHLPGELVPEADALVNPRVASAPGLDDLCGSGVAFFLASALARRAVAEGLYAGAKFCGPLLVLAGLATVTDLVSLKGQNRILVAQSLANFRTSAPIGLRELLDRSQRRAESVSARDYGFALGPRINAAGRAEPQVATAREAYELVVAEDREQARVLAKRVDDLNALRKSQERRIEDEARCQISAEAARTAVVVRGTDWNPGVIGIVAARILETVHVPVAVAVGDTGSVRAPTGYNVHEALMASSEHLLRFGGHAAAGGFTVRPGSFEGFREAFSRACAAQRERSPAGPVQAFDGWIDPGDITLELYESLRGLEPFGEGNPQPVFGLQGVTFSRVVVMGAEGRHLSIAFADRAIPRAVWWGHGAQAESLRGGSFRRFDVFFTLTVSDYGGEPLHVELCLVDVRPSDEACGL